MTKKVLLSVFIIFLVSCSSPNSNLNTSVEINRKLETIMESPAMSSNPYQYIKQHPEEYTFLVAQGEVTLRQFLSELAAADHNGLREYIMAVVCIEILGAKNPVRTWDSGKDWYEQYQQKRR